MATPNYPTMADGDALTIIEATFSIDGVSYPGLETLKWTNAIEGNELVYGSQFAPYAETTGTYKGSVEWELNYFQYRKLIQRLGNPYMTKRFNVVVNLRGPRTGLSTLVIPKCRIVEDSGAIERGKNVVIPAKMTVLGVIEMDGAMAAPGIARASSNFSSALSISGSVGGIAASFGISV